MTPIEVLRIASVYIRARDIIVEPRSCTIAGLWIGCEPVQLLNHDVDPVDLGAAIRAALLASMVGVLLQTDWKTLMTPLLKTAKVRSWNALQKSAKMCSVEASPSYIRIVPTVNGGVSGPEKGYQSRSEEAIVLALECSNRELGDALRKAAERCT